MDKRFLIMGLAFSISFFILFGVFFVYEGINTYNAHSTFLGYCNWRGLEPINQTSNYGYCNSSSGQIYKIVLFNGRWYLGGDLPNNSLF